MMTLERPRERQGLGMTYTSTRGFGQQQKTIAPQSVLAELSQLPVPEAVEDEYGILSCIFNSYDAQATFQQAANLLRPEHFLTPTLNKIWKGMLEAHQKNLPAEFRVQANYLQDFENIQSETLKDVLDRISTSLHDPDNILHYAERIVRKSESRELLRALSTGARAALDSSVSPEEALIIAERNLREVREIVTSKKINRSGTAKDLGREMIENLKKIARGELKRDVIKTNCWYEFDQACQGFLPGDVVVIGAPPSGGKTTMGAGLADAFSSQGIFTLWISLEDDPYKCMGKIFAANTKLTQGAITRGDDLGLADIEKLESVIEKKGSHLKITQPMSISVEGVEQAIAQAESDMREEHGDAFTGFRVVIFDYLQYLGEFVDSIYKTSVISSATARIGKICKDMNATLFAFAQYNTEIAKGKRPTDIVVFADCNSIGKHADMIIGLHCDGYANREQLHTYKTLECIWIKNRCGGNASISLGIDWTHGWIYSLLGKDGKGMEYPADPARIQLPKAEQPKQLPEATDPEVAPDEDFEEEDFSAKYNDPDLEVVALPKPLEPLKTVEVIPEVSLVVEPAIEVDQEVVEPESPVELPVIGEVAEGAIVVGDVEYEIGEEVKFLAYKRNSTARLLGWDGEELKIEHLESVPDPNPEGSGKKYLRETGKIESVSTSRIAKLSRD